MSLNVWNLNRILFHCSALLEETYTFISYKNNMEIFLDTQNVLIVSPLLILLSCLKYLI